MTSAAAFVEGGVQDACDDACSICLENFGEDDPATVTVCKHEYHLQCILEWSQRSKECPMCLQPLSLKDPDNQAFLVTAEQERVVRYQRSPPFYQHPVLGGTEFRSFGPRYGDDSDLEDRIMHHLAAAALGRAQQYARREEAMRFRPSSHQGLPNFMIVPSQSNPSSAQMSTVAVTSASSLPRQVSAPNPDLSIVGGITSHNSAGQSTPTYSRLMSDPLPGQIGSVESFSLRQQTQHEPVGESPQGGSSSEISFSETMKSRLAAASSRYRESLTKTTRGFRELLRARNGTMAELGARAREMRSGVVRAVERMSLESPEKSRDGRSPDSSARSPDSSARSPDSSARSPDLSARSPDSNAVLETRRPGLGEGTSHGYDHQPEAFTTLPV